MCSRSFWKLVIGKRIELWILRVPRHSCITSDYEFPFLSEILEGTPRCEVKKNRSAIVEAGRLGLDRMADHTDVVVSSVSLAALEALQSKPKLWSSPTLSSFWCSNCGAGRRGDSAKVTQPAFASGHDTHMELCSRALCLFEKWLALAAVLDLCSEIPSSQQVLLILAHSLYNIAQHAHTYFFLSCSVLQDHLTSEDSACLAWSLSPLG